MSHNYPGTFITVEGIDGAGKSTVVEAIKEHYGEDEVVTTAEPTDTWMGDSVYRAISEDSEIDSLATFFLFMGDRVHNIENRIIPALSRGRIVVSDRFSDSTWAYQREALREEFDEPWDFIEDAMCPWNLTPDITLYLDINTETAIERADGEDKYEKEEFLKQVRKNYSALRYRNRERFHRIDGEQSKEKVKDEAVEVIEEWG